MTKRRQDEKVSFVRWLLNFREIFTTVYLVEIIMKTRRKINIRKRSTVPPSTRSPSKEEYRSKKSSSSPHSSQTEWHKNMSSLNPRALQLQDLRREKERENFLSLTTQHNRKIRDTDAISSSKVGSIECGSSLTFTISYESDYKVWNNFSIMYQGKTYDYNQYRIIEEGLQVCNSSNTTIQQRWQHLITKKKEKMASRHCNITVDGYPQRDYVVYKDLAVFLKLTVQNFTRRDHGVIHGHFAICRKSLVCRAKTIWLKKSTGENSWF